MSRLVCLLVLSLGLIQGLDAQENQQETAPQDDFHSEAREPASTATPPVAVAQSQIQELLMRKFGVARAKAEQISAAVMSSAAKYSLPPELLLAIISIESRFREKAKGANDATGLMQVVPSAHRQLVKHINLTEPTANIEAGSSILHGYLQSAQGDLNAALKSYGGSAAYAKKVSLRVQEFLTTDATQAPGIAAQASAAAVAQ
jgi:soluble lytic murein transglycosylase-like protein